MKKLTSYFFQGILYLAPISITIYVIYLIFNEGFHSGDQQQLIREELCGEALRLCRMLINNEYRRTSDVFALFALCCFNASRLKSKMGEGDEVISLEFQNRSIWDKDLIMLRNQAMNRAVQTEDYSAYHYEAAIASEHLSAKSYDKTNWHRIYRWYTCLVAIDPSPLNLLSMAMAQLQRGEAEGCKTILQKIDTIRSGQCTYLYHGVWAEYYFKIDNPKAAIGCLDLALSLVSNIAEKKYLKKKKSDRIGGS